jgi:hypothetical protein
MQQLPLQSSLFETPRPTISGLTYIPDFIDSTTESVLIKTIDAQP